MYLAVQLQMADKVGLNVWWYLLGSALISTCCVVFVAACHVVTLWIWIFSSWLVGPLWDSEEIYSEDSIDLLQRSGIDFKAHEAKGIDPTDFAEVMMTSGLVLTEDVKWITFHSAYDFAYLLKVLTDSNLPKDEAGFFELFHSYFPCAYDLKCLMRHIDGGHGGLNRIAELLEACAVLLLGSTLILAHAHCLL